VLLLDDSAWARRRHPAVRERIAALLRDRRLGICMPFLLEAGYSARSGREHEALVKDLGRLWRVEITADVERLALEAQSELARMGHHRLPPTDVVIAACAHVAGGGVLHYDGDYDVLAERTKLDFASEWLAPAGSL
jgi:predicted nucleic acid-binding protein